MDRNDTLAHWEADHRDGQMATAEASLTGADGKLYAYATTTFLIFNRPGAL